MAVPHAPFDMVIGHLRDLVDTASSVDTAPLLAHQGGWDELLMVVAPIVIFALLLRAANRRAARLEQEREDGAAEPPTAPPTNPRRGPI
jgi:hypothetical protein